MGERATRSPTQAQLAVVHEEIGDVVAAKDAIGLAEELDDPQDVANDVILANVKARLALREGDLNAAEQHAQRALEHAFRTDFAQEHSDVHTTLARVHSSGRDAAALVETNSVLEIAERAGDRPKIDAAHTLIREVRVDGDSGGPVHR